MNWFLHGALGAPDDWAPWRNASDEAVDLHADVAPFGVWAEAFCARVKAVDPEPVLVGYSMGGRLALHALLAGPRIWCRAIIVSAHTGLAEHDARLCRLEHDLKWAEMARSLPWSEFLAEWNAQPVFAGTSAGLLGRVELEARRLAIATAFDCWSLGRQENLLPQFGALDFPVLWIAGERDAKFSEIARAAVKMLPQGRLGIVPGAGHRVPWDAPESFRTFVHAESG